MSTDSPTATNGRVRQFENQLRDAVLEELKQRDLQNPDPLAANLGVLPLAAAELLRSSHWSIDTALWIVDRLDLPVEVSVTHR